MAGLPPSEPTHVPPTTPLNQISPRGAVLMGMLCFACGVVPVLGGLGVINVHSAPDVARWVVVAAGAMFMLGGLAIINGYALWGAPTADGDLAADAPFAARLAQLLLGATMVALMFVVFAWVAFGPGQRHFSASISVPGMSTNARSSERTGRIVFGTGAVLIGLFFVAATVSGARRLMRNLATRGARASGE